MTLERGYAELPINTYGEFNLAKARLIDILDELEGIALELGLEEMGSENLKRARHLITQDVFRIVFVGGFSRGKSTVVNALLGEKILPSKLSPTTAVITIVRYGEDKQATIFYKDEQMKPETVPIERLREFVIIPKGGHTEDSLGSRIDTPIEKIEISYPFDLCRNGVEIVDTPGLDDDYSRNKIVMGYLPNSDAAVVVLSSQQVLTEDETRLIEEELIPRGFSHIFYLINFADEPMSSEEKKQVMSRFRRIIGSEERTFLVSAKQSLEAKIRGDMDDPYLRVFSEFEKDLESFVVKERGPHKLMSSSLLVQNVIDDCRILLSTRMHLLEEKNLDDLILIEEEFKQNKSLLLSRKDEMVEAIGRRAAEIADRVEESFVRKCDEVEEGLAGLPLTVSMGRVEKLVKVQQYQEEIMSQYHRYVVDELNDWAIMEAGEIMRSGMEDLVQFATEEARVISEQIGVLTNLLNPGFEVSTTSENTGLQRLLAAVAGLLIGDLGVAVTGGLLGAKDAAISFGAVATANIGLYLVGLLNPVTAMLASALTAGAVIKWRSGEIDKEIQRDVADAVIQALRDLKRTRKRDIRHKVFEGAQSCGRAVDEAVNAMARDLEAQLEKAKEDLTAGKDEILAHYREAENRIASMQETLSQLHTLLGGTGSGGSEVALHSR